MGGDGGRGERAGGRRPGSRPPAPPPRCIRSCAPWRRSRATCRCCGRTSRPTRSSCSSRAAASVPSRRTRRAGWPRRRCGPRGVGRARPCAHGGGAAAGLRLPRRCPGRPTQWEAFLTEELALEGSDPRLPSWRLDEVGAGGATFRCAVVGAGASGLAAAHRLRQAGVDVTVFEKNGDVGGTWLENVYPGCRVDVPNQLYSFSFAQTNDWVSRFSAQPDLLAYLQGTAKELGLGECIRFASEVTEARFDDDAREWSLTVRAGDGTVRTEAFDGVVCAVGQLNRPSFPAIAGRERFAGPSFHSAAWDDSVELAGRRVAVIGTGASAAQFVPCLVDEVAHLDVFQRTPPWLLPTENYGDPFPPEFHDLLGLLPNYGRWDRLWQFWLMHEGLLGGRARRSRVGRAHRGGERGQRLRAVDADRRPAGPGGGRRALREDGAPLPALRQARPAGRRAVGGRHGPGPRRPRDDPDRRDHARRACARWTARSTRRTC